MRRPRPWPYTRFFAVDRPIAVRINGNRGSLSVFSVLAANLAAIDEGAVG